MIRPKTNEDLTSGIWNWLWLLEKTIVNLQKLASALCPLVCFHFAVPEKQTSSSSDSAAIIGGAVCGAVVLIVLIDVLLMRILLVSFFY